VSGCQFCSLEGDSSKGLQSEDESSNRVRMRRVYTVGAPSKTVVNKWFKRLQEFRDQGGRRLESSLPDQSFQSHTGLKRRVCPHRPQQILLFMMND
jgi:hypothetical protein